MCDADTHIVHLVGRRDGVDVPRTRQRIGFRHEFESHRLGIDPDAEDATLLAHRRTFLGAFQRDHDVVFALGQKIGRKTVDCAEDREVGAAEVGGDGDLVGGNADIEFFGELLAARLCDRRGRESQSHEDDCEKAGYKTGHQKPDPDEITE